MGGEAGPSQLTRIRPRQGRATKQGEVSICVFSGIAPVSNGKKDAAPEDVSVQGPDAPLAHRRPGYSSSGCTPAEPDFASPGNGILSWPRMRRNERAIVEVTVRLSKEFTSRSRAGLRLHPGVRHGALRRRRCEWEQPHIFHGAPLSRMMPNGCLGSPVIVLLFGLDRGFLMDVGPNQVMRSGR